MLLKEFWLMKKSCQWQLNSLKVCFSFCGVLVFWLNLFIFYSFVFLLAQDQFDTIDLSDNEIVKLENFPFLNRLGTILLNNNRITRINPNIGGETIKRIECYFQYYGMDFRI